MKKFNNIFHLYIPKCYLVDVAKFNDKVDKPGRVICELIRQFNKGNIVFDLPTIEKELKERGYKIERV